MVPVSLSMKVGMKPEVHRNLRKSNIRKRHNVSFVGLSGFYSIFQHTDGKRPHSMACRDQHGDQSSLKIAHAAFQWISCSCSFRGASFRASQSGASLQLWCKVGRHSATMSHESSSSRRSVAGCNPVMSAVHVVQKSACARRVVPSNGTFDIPCSCEPCSCT